MWAAYILVDVHEFLSHVLAVMGKKDSWHIGGCRK